MPQAHSHLRICDFTGKPAGAGATRLPGAFGALGVRSRHRLAGYRHGMEPYAVVAAVGDIANR